MTAEQGGQSAENDATGCHPLLVCTDRPELCPPACRPVVRNAGSNGYDPALGLVARGVMSDEHDPASCEAGCCIPPGSGVE